jgi:hypothetical protein
MLGCEMSLSCAGFLPGDSALDRIAAVTDPALHKPDTMAALASGLERVP